MLGSLQKGVTAAEKSDKQECKEKMELMKLQQNLLRTMCDATDGDDAAAATDGDAANADGDDVASVPADDATSVPAADDDATSVPAADDDATVPAADDDAAVPATDDDATVPGCSNYELWESNARGVPNTPYDGTTHYDPSIRSGPCCSYNGTCAGPFCRRCRSREDLDTSQLQNIGTYKSL